jgi:hypothetical protein
LRCNGGLDLRQLKLSSDQEPSARDSLRAVNAAIALLNPARRAAADRAKALADFWQTFGLEPKS